MINFFLKIFISLFLSSFTGLMIAQKKDTLPALDSLPSQTLAEVVITANRYGSLLIKTSEAIGVVVSKSIQQFQLRTVPEALLLTPGVFVQKTNHGGGSPFLRGLTGNQTLLPISLWLIGVCIRATYRIPIGGTPGWNVFNVNTSYAMRFIKVNLSLLNLFNEDYRFHGSVVNGYGRSAFLSVIVNYLCTKNHTK